MSSEAQDAQERVHRAVRGFVGDIDRRFLRPMELETHLAAADCCRDTESSTEKVHACIEKSQSQALRAQQYMQAEMQRFQEGLNRCVLTCQDQVKDKVTPSTPEAEINKHRMDFEACAIKCCDDKINTLPTLSKKVEQTFKSGQF